MYMTFCIKVWKYLFYLFYRFDAFGSFFEVNLVVQFVDNFQILSDLLNIEKGVLNKFIEDELVLRVSFDLFAGKEVEDGFGFQPAPIQLCEFIIINVIILFPEQDPTSQHKYSRRLMQFWSTLFTVISKHKLSSSLGSGECSYNILSCPFIIIINNIVNKSYPLYQLSSSAVVLSTPRSW